MEIDVPSLVACGWAVVWMVAGGDGVEDGMDDVMWKVSCDIVSGMHVRDCGCWCVGWVMQGDGS